MDTRDLVHVRHIIDYLHEGLSFSEGETRDSLEQDRLLTLALCGSAVMVGAAMSRISDDFQKLNPHIPWRDALRLQDLEVTQLKKTS